MRNKREGRVEKGRKDGGAGWSGKNAIRRAKAERLKENEQSGCIEIRVGGGKIEPQTRR